MSYLKRKVIIDAEIPKQQKGMGLYPSEKYNGFYMYYSPDSLIQVENLTQKYKENLFLDVLLCKGDLFLKNNGINDMYFLRDHPNQYKILYIPNPSFPNLESIYENFELGSSIFTKNNQLEFVLQLWDKNYEVESIRNLLVTERIFYYSRLKKINKVNQIFVRYKKTFKKDFVTTCKLELPLIDTKNIVKNDDYYCIKWNQGFINIPLLSTQVDFVYNNKQYVCCLYENQIQEEMLIKLQDMNLKNVSKIVTFGKVQDMIDKSIDLTFQCYIVYQKPRGIGLWECYPQNMTYYDVFKIIMKVILLMKYLIDESVYYLNIHCNNLYIHFDEDEYVLTLFNIETISIENEENHVNNIRFHIGILFLSLLLYCDKTTKNLSELYNEIKKMILDVNDCYELVNNEIYFHSIPFNLKRLIVKEFLFSKETSFDLNEKLLGFFTSFQDDIIMKSKNFTQKEVNEMIQDYKNNLYYFVPSNLKQKIFKIKKNILPSVLL